MRNDQKQLFHLLHDVDISHDSRYNPIGKSYSPAKLIIPATFAVTYPSGEPCTLIENYLIAKYREGATVREDGGSLRATVSKLSHLIRHCWNMSRDFWELTNDDLDLLIENLMAETRKNAPLARVRDNNTVRAIIAAVIDFLLWIQEEVFTELKLVGKGKNYKIRILEKRIFDARGGPQGVHLMYFRLPPPETKEPKRPISREKRNLLWQAVADLSVGENNFTPRLQKIFDSLELQAYLKARRELLLELLEATGARPGELAALNVSDNENCYKNEELVLITLKRRRDISRKIKLQPGVAMKLTIFIQKYRANLVRKLSALNISLDTNNCVFLSVEGNHISARTMVCEFRLLSKAAGLNDYQSCMSMFRHRFITKQVAIHLGIYIGENNKTKALMTDADYRTVLKKVASITGHANELSLLYYLDMAWEELGVFDRVQAAILIDASVEGAITKVIGLIGNLRAAKKKPSIDIFESTIEALTGLQQEIRLALNRY